MSRPFFPAMAQQSYEQNINVQRTASIDSNAFDPFPPNGLNTPVYASTGNAALAGNPMTPQQLQYQQAILAASARPGAFYATPLGGMNAYPSPAPSLDAFRGNPGLGSSPMMTPSQPGFPQAFNPAMAHQVYGYPLQYTTAHQQSHAQAAGAARRARVS